MSRSCSFVLLAKTFDVHILIKMEYQPSIKLKYRPYFTNCVQWNEEGQMVICLENQVHIITPLITGMFATKEHYLHTGFKLTPLEKETCFDLIVDVNDLQTSYLSAEGFRCANWSPIGISESQSCFLVVVTTKHRVLIYQNSKENPSTGNWELYMDLTESVKKLSIHHDHPTRKEPYHTIYANWSTRLITDPIVTKPVFLALSNKAGDLLIWSYTKQLKYVTTITPHTSFVNLLSWTGWTKIRNDDMTDNDYEIYTSYIISACTDGTIALSSVCVQATVDQESRETILSDDIKVNTEIVWFEDTTSVTTLLKIHDNLEAGGSDIKIAVSKGISIKFLWLTCRDGTLSVKHDWTSYQMENSALGLTGGDWLNDHVFRCYTTEGEGLQIELDEEGEIKYDEDESNVINDLLETMYGQQWMDEQMDAEDDNLIASSDAIPYVFGAADGLNHVWTAFYFAMRPTVDIHYRPESSEECNLSIIVQKKRGENMDFYLQELDRYVNDPSFFFVRSARGIIRETLEYLIDDDNIDNLITWIHHLATYLNIQPKLDSTCIPRAIYSEPSNIAARMLITTELELKNFIPQNFKSTLSPLVEESKNLVQATFIANILNYVLQLSDEEFSQFTEQDITVLLILSDSSFTIKNKMGLVQQSLNTYQRLQANFPDLRLQEIIDFASHYSEEDDIEVIKKQKREMCPVCDEYIQVMNDSLMGLCHAGHFWQLCAITKRVLYTRKARKCISCGSRSLEPTKTKSLTNKILKVVINVFIVDVPL
ncbi:transcription factor IIIC subunit delta N-term-domain-containing protein [Cokeromyces recurvatus]|uniref:transcription factor IIIC subunit delta N-term-domain-containing protein n=1 Tax=Cokeromyces recurvatus TaxID=90255 RepID=UPI0022202514|nr:transcription factor IIIC subunit delta N-term-domain-containing protein [Cokeromyces recurvatus]KAI7900588.1 transcription factor IIIC subunit delta N-term-domain-containing protein [Cokeromyces recurvatus]